MQRGSALILSLLAGLIILGGIFYLNKTSLLLRNKSTRPVDQISPQSENKYNTYTNQQLGFEFKQPNELIIKEDSEAEFNKRGNGDFRKNFKGYVGYEPGKFMGAVAVLGEDLDYETNPLSIWIFDNPDDLSIDKWYGNFWYYPYVWGDFTSRRELVKPAEEATVSGQLGKSGVVGYKEGKPKFVYLSQDKKMYLFRIIGDGGQILSSFKFLNQKSTICKITGCSGQICSDEEVMTTCEYRNEYACYKNALCERQADGKCGWTQTEELTECLQEKKSE